jgi:hypothetical protein
LYTFVCTLWNETKNNEFYADAYDTAHFHAAIIIDLCGHSDEKAIRGARIELIVDERNHCDWLIEYVSESVSC